MQWKQDEVSLMLLFALYKIYILLHMYVIVITQARVLCLIYTHDARGRVRIYQANDMRFIHWLFPLI